jgi:hypothetical protein
MYGRWRPSSPVLFPVSRRHQESPAIVHNFVNVLPLSTQPVIRRAVTAALLEWLKNEDVASR